MNLKIYRGVLVLLILFSIYGYQNQFADLVIFIMKIFNPNLTIWDVDTFFIENGAMLKEVFLVTFLASLLALWGSFRKDRG